MLLRQQTSQLHQVALKADFERLIAVDRNGNASTDGVYSSFYDILKKDGDKLTFGASQASDAYNWNMSSDPAKRSIKLATDFSFAKIGN